jgi:hypothetical protein
MAIVLLAMQISGLHVHRHVELGSGPPGHGVQLHVEDSGIHRSADAHHRHADVTTAHAHIDVETRVLDAGLLKPGLKLPMFAIFAIIALLGVLILRHIVLSPPFQRLLPRV